MTTDDQSKFPDRSSPFWEGAFLRAYEHLLSQLTGKDDPPLPHHALLATRMADQCVRARADRGSASCPNCNGTGCDACAWSGKADRIGTARKQQPTIPVLHALPGAAVEATTELDSEPPPPLTGR